MTAGDRIRTARKAAKLTQKELGARLGVTYQTIAQWENNLRNPKQETIQRIANALNVSAASLNGWDNARDRLNSAGLSLDDVAYEMNIPVETLQKIISNEDAALSEAMPKVIQVAILLASEMEKNALARREQEMKDYAARRFEEANIWKEGKDRINTAFDSLNTSGQQEAVKRVEELTEIPRYRRTPEPSPLSAGIKVYGDGPAGSFPPAQDPAQPPAEASPAQDTPAAQDAPDGAEEAE